MANYLDVDTGIHTVAKAWGCSEVQALDNVELMRRDFRMAAGGRVIHSVLGLDIDDPKVKTYYEQNHPSRLPMVVAQNLADQAFLGQGSLKARAELAKSMPKDQLEALAVSYGLRSIHDTRPGCRPERSTSNGNGSEDHSNNPWADSPRNIDPRTGRYTANAITRQAALVRTDLRAAAGVASAVGATIGCTSPPTRQRRHA